MTPYLYLLKIKLVGQDIQTSEPQTDRQTHTQTGANVLPRCTREW